MAAVSRRGALRLSRPIGLAQKSTSVAGVSTYAPLALTIMAVEAKRPCSASAARKVANLHIIVEVIVPPPIRRTHGDSLIVPCTAGRRVIGTTAAAFIDIEVVVHSRGNLEPDLMFDEC